MTVTTVENGISSQISQIQAIHRPRAHCLERRPNLRVEKPSCTAKSIHDNYFPSLSPQGICGHLSLLGLP